RVVDPVPSLAAERKLRLARTMADWVVVFVHWGAELRDWPQPDQRRQAAWFVAHGADLIIGAHPHVPIAPDCVDGRPVFYSL
ncbi:CapA family protein, partial [Acinetobacter baumannii]